VSENLQGKEVAHVKEKRSCRQRQSEACKLTETELSRERETSSSFGVYYSSRHFFFQYKGLERFSLCFMKNRVFKSMLVIISSFKGY